MRHMQKEAYMGVQTGIDIKLVVISVLARRYGVSVRCIQKWTAAGILPVHKLGRRCIRYDVAACDAAMDKFSTRAACLGRKGGQD